MLRGAIGMHGRPTGRWYELRVLGQPVREGSNQIQWCAHRVGMGESPACRWRNSVVEALIRRTRSPAVG